MNIIEGYNIQVKSKDKLILNINEIKIPQGRVFACIGPNGAGKSTLIRVLTFLQNPHKGEIFYNGEKVRQKEIIKIRRKMAVVFQEPLLLNTTVKENILLGLKIRGVDSKTAEKKARFWMEKLKVSHLEKRWARLLSGGEAKRVSIARALALEPEIIFLDEPFANLDEFGKGDLLMELTEILKSTSMTAFFVSHEKKEISVLADRGIILESGKIIKQGSIEEILTLDY
ncbi:energy-coupling factor ABC transporter ATP-binding protein [Thermovenabulum gondwanense]|uniref:Choline transport ATP-binding protein OpuBA n=1 Tax=Thermovenabulum gondwanense TaxID=520767 RepID=A0A162MV40_9FIRM|nr:ATP-binding cassette domain-containing protein [Thermovenabulum gondwanense]KYO67788.1 Choline transport ATP-binding protein OpuBA [Thermovenabulum gondwanense]